MKLKHMKIKYSVFTPQKVRKHLFSLKKAFHEEQTFLGKFMGGLFYIRSNDQIMQRGRKSFANAFSSNLNSVNLKISPGHGGRDT